MLEVEVQLDRLNQTTRKLPQEEVTADMEVLVLHTEIPQGSTCAVVKMGGGEITHKDLKGDCRNDH
eukprot:7719083-Heterocapsa_arctica.AAC.1